MALETTSMPLGIRPLSRPQMPSSTDGIVRRDDGTSSGFSPRTDLSIKNSVEDMAGILSKIASDRVDTMQKIPADLQQVVQNIMKNAFSLENSLLQGFGSSLESQRFSLEQLQIFARMLTQLGALADKGFSTNFSETMQTLLTNLKNYLSQETNGNIEPVLLNKFAFELIDTKSVTDLPPVLQELLTGKQMPTVSSETGDALALLKQLVRSFMPRPEVNADGNTANSGNMGAMPGTTNNQSSPFGNSNFGSPNLSGNTAQNLGNSGMPTASNAAGNFNPNPNATGVNNTGNMTGNATQGTSVPNGQFAAGGNGNTVSFPSTQQPNAANTSPGNFAPMPNVGGGDPTAPFAQSNNLAANANINANANTNVGTETDAGRGGNIDNNANTVSDTGNNRADTAQNQSGNRSATGASELNLNELRDWLTRRGGGRGSAPQPATSDENLSPLQQAKNQILREPLQNIPSTMDTMKSLAQLLIRNNTAMTPQDAALLQNFVNGNEPVLSERDARQLQTLLRICQQNIPASVQQAAVQQNMPDLTRLWAFMQLCDMAMTKNMTGAQLKKAGKSVGEFTNSVKRSTAGGNSVVHGKRSLNFMLPLFFGDETTSYPAYVHVYDEDAVDKYSGEWKKETWLRICLLTDNIGAVEMVCRIYEGQQLDVRLFFSDRNTAQEFREYLPQLRRDMRGNSKLRLRELKVGAAGERRFL